MSRIITCQYCGGDYDPEFAIDATEHAVYCPWVTGLWPVQDDKGRPSPARCMACQTPFQHGESYVKRPLTEEEAEASPYAAAIGTATLVDPANTCAVCVGCGIPDLDA